MPFNLTVNAGWIYNTGDVVTAANLNAHGVPVVTLDDGETFAAAQGSLSNPGYAFDGDPDTGTAQLAGADTFSAVAGGNEVVRFTPLQALARTGTLANPSIGIIGDTDAGINFPSPGVGQLISEGQERARWDSNGFTIGGAPVLTAGISPVQAFIATDFLEGLTRSPFVVTTANGGTVVNGNTVVPGQDTGILRVSLGTSANSSAAICSVVPMSVGSTQIWRIRTFSGSLSNGTNRYYVIIGAGSNGAGETLVTGGTDSAWFEYDDATSAQWRCVSRRIGTKQVTTTSVTVASGGPYTFKIVTDTNGSYFYINGNLVASHTIYYPFLTQPTYPIIKIENTVGVGGSQFIDVDSFQMSYTISRP